MRAAWSSAFPLWSKIPVLPTNSSANPSSAPTENRSPSRSISLSHSVTGKTYSSRAANGRRVKRLIFSSSAASGTERDFPPPSGPFFCAYDFVMM